jgi:ADP-ribose pyrophosphatase YjhB (NUDIX family)
MTIEDDARRVVDIELDRLHERFDAFDVTEATVENDPDFYDHGLDRIRRTGMLADAGALVRDRRGRTLFVRHPAAPETWTTPGGGYEAEDESLVATAIREIREETTVSCAVTEIRSVRIKTIEHRDEQRSYPMLTVAFVAHGEGSASAAEDEEILEARWFADPPDEFGNND